MTVRLKGRERAYPEIGLEKLEKARKELEDIARPDAEPRAKGNLISVTFIKV